MPLLINGNPIQYKPDTSTIKALVTNFDWQKDMISSFESSNSKLTKKSLIVLQGEVASINNTRFDSIGTPHATTCNIVFFMNKNNTKVICAHLDDGVDKHQLNNIYNLFTKIELQNGLNMYLIGGYNDDKLSSIKITNQIFKLITKQRKFKNYNVNLKLLYTATLNTKYKKVYNKKLKEFEIIPTPIPKYQNIGYNIIQKTFYSFDISSDNIPYYTLRSAVIFKNSNKGLNILYNCCDNNDKLKGAKIKSFKWKCPKWVNDVINYNVSDQQILDFFSSSPDAEYDEFVKDARALFYYVARNTSKNVFKKGTIYLACGVILNDNNSNSIDNDDNNSNNDINNGNNDDNTHDDQKTQ